MFEFLHIVSLSEEREKLVQRSFPLLLLETKTFSFLVPVIIYISHCYLYSTTGVKVVVNSIHEPGIKSSDRDGFVLDRVAWDTRPLGHIKGHHLLINCTLGEVSIEEFLVVPHKCLLLLSRCSVVSH